MSEDRRRLKIWVGFAFWLLAFGLSLTLALASEPTGSGFTRGLNRVGTLFRWQFLAFALAIFVWISGRGAAESLGRLQVLSRVPIYIQCLLGLVAAAIVVLAVVFR